MTESVDTTLIRLYEAAPKIAWYVAPDASDTVKDAALFEDIPEDLRKRQDYPPTCLGRLFDCWVYEDENLPSRTIELRSGNDVLSSATLEG